MPRPPALPSTSLGAAVQDRRAGEPMRALAERLQVANTTLSSIERGTHAPSVATARALAKWLGWTVEQVLDAADQPAPPAPPSQERRP